MITKHRLLVIVALAFATPSGADAQAIAQKTSHRGLFIGVSADVLEARADSFDTVRGGGISVTLGMGLTSRFSVPF